MRLATLVLAVALTTGGALAFDFSLVGGDDWGNLSQASGGIGVPDFEVGVNDFNSWHFQDDDPVMWTATTASDGPAGPGDIWVKHDRWSGIKLIQLANLPPIGTVVQLSADYIQEQAFPDRGMYLNGVDTGLTLGLSGGNEDDLIDGTFGTNYAYGESSSLLPTTSTWQTATLEGMITTSHDYLAVILMQAGDNAGNDRGFDNVELSIVRVAGDGNNDGTTDDADYTIWADNYLATGVGIDGGDFNGDGTVDDADYTIWADNYGQTLATVPEPASMGLLGLGVWALLRRRK